MSLSLYDASIPGYARMLRNLSAIFAKAEAHAAANGVDLQTYVDARLAPDMASLVGQVQLATDAAKGGAARLAGVTPPSFPDTETAWAELKARIEKTIAFLETIKREQVDGGEDRTVELPLPGRTLTFTARDFLFQFSLPNFHFHVVTAYALLRAQGVPLGKVDYLAGGQAF
ncbi:DUF1993 domain-containing protein [Phenylobacterium sp.]|uniref:DUF1993 domain-containing protein n=1 Tax=Phenylobacterium sp. TaxID=1871053 RepID=UPI002E319797|nr:DUF1993 domain-containing protein [Phenylobacterium sp.]HEX2559499.1 DUF1993 domain-containing protein [Phenylobacterium sp.]